MFITMITAATAAKLLMAAKIAIAVGPVFMAAQRVVDNKKRKKARE